LGRNSTGYCGSAPLVTLVNDTLRHLLQEGCVRLQVQAIPVLDRAENSGAPFSTKAIVIERWCDRSIEVVAVLFTTRPFFD
jgi:hypothetical protein